MKTWYLIYMKRPGITPFLYAITSNKKLKDSFLRERNPKLFFCRKKELDKEGENILCLQSRGKILTKQAFTTRNSDGNQEVELIVTADEDMGTYTHDTDILKIVSKFIDHEVCNVTDDILKALNTLSYFTIMNYVSEISDPFLDGVEVEEPFNGFSFDRLGVFIKLFGDTLNI